MNSNSKKKAYGLRPSSKAEDIAIGAISTKVAALLINTYHKRGCVINSSGKAHMDKPRNYKHFFSKATDKCIIRAMSTTL